MPIYHAGKAKPTKPTKPVTDREIARVLSGRVDATQAQILAADRALVTLFPTITYRRERIVMAAAIATSTDTRRLKAFIRDVGKSLPGWFEAATGKKLDINP